MHVTVVKYNKMCIIRIRKTHIIVPHTSQSSPLFTISYSDKNNFPRNIETFPLPEDLKFHVY